MKKILLAVLVAAFSCAAFGQAVVIGNNAPVVATFTQSGLVANLSLTTIFTAPSAGFYRVTGYEVITTAATSSSTLPNMQMAWTDGMTSVSEGPTSFSGNLATNTVGNVELNNGANTGIYVAAGTAIKIQTANYASVGGTAMAYTIRVKLEFLGN